MTEQVRQVLDLALKLTPGQRAELMAELAASLDDEELDPAWLAEIDRRIEEVEQGADRGASWSDVKARIRARHVKRTP